MNSGRICGWKKMKEPVLRQPQADSTQRLTILFKSCHFPPMLSLPRIRWESIPPRHRSMRMGIFHLPQDQQDRLLVHLLLQFQFLSLQRERLPLDMDMDERDRDCSTNRPGSGSRSGARDRDEKITAASSSIQWILRSH